MNFVEKWIERKLRRVSWKIVTLNNSSSFSKMQAQIRQYRWIIKNSENQILYDTEKSGYEGLINFPAAVSALEIIANTEKAKIKNKKFIEKQEIVFTLDPRLWSIFPYEQLEEMCIS